jgi:hypothetical protein
MYSWQRNCVEINCHLHAPAALSSGKSPGTHYIWGLVGSRPGLDDTEKGKSSLYRDSNTDPSVVQPADSRYPGSVKNCYLSENRLTFSQTLPLQLSEYTVHLRSAYTGHTKLHDRNRSSNASWVYQKKKGLIRHVFNIWRRYHIRGTIAIYSENNMKRINTVYGKNAELLNVKASATTVKVTFW